MKGKGNQRKRGGVLMTELENLQRRITILEDVEGIKKLKSRYWRCIDRKLWDELADCFVEDVVFEIVQPPIKLQGRKEIPEFLAKRLGSAITVHQGHNAEIEVTSDRTAKGMWTLYDDIRDVQRNTTLRGYGFYEDEYAKENGGWGGWKIKRLKFIRSFMERSRWDG
jgi:hypothetical protein